METGGNYGELLTFKSKISGVFDTRGSDVDSVPFLDWNVTVISDGYLDFEIKYLEMK